MSKIFKYSEFILEYLKPYPGSDSLRSSKYNEYYRKYSNEDYGSRAKSYGISSSDTVLQKTENFFQNMENRINAIADQMGYAQNIRRYSRGGNLNTGIELLYSLPSVVPSVLKRIFAPTKTGYSSPWEGVKFNKVGKGDTDQDIDFIRHTNNEFIKNDLGNIKNEKDLEDHISGLYKRGKVKVGEDPILDDVARNRANIFYSSKA